MKTYEHLLEHLAEIFPEWEIFQADVVEKFKHAFYVQKPYFFPRKSWRLCDNLGKHGRTGQATDDNMIPSKSFACRITKTTDTHLEYVIIIVFPPQQWLHERGSNVIHTLSDVLQYLTYKQHTITILCLWPKCLVSRDYQSSPPNHKTIKQSVRLSSFLKCHLTTISVVEILQRRSMKEHGSSGKWYRQGKAEVSKRKVSRCYFVHHKSHIDWSWLNADLRCERLAINRLNQDAALRIVLLQPTKKPEPKLPILQRSITLVIQHSRKTKFSVLVHSFRCQWACGKVRPTSVTDFSQASSTETRNKGSHASSSSVNPMYTIYSVSNFGLSALFPLIIFPTPHQYNCIWLMSFIISCMFYGNPLSLHPRLL